MTFRELDAAARMVIARKNRSPCPLCPEDLHRKAAALPWRFCCPVHDVEFRDATGETLSDRFGTDCFKLEGHAEAGAAHLDAWARGAGQGDLGVPEVLQGSDRTASPRLPAVRRRATADVAAGPAGLPWLSYDADHPAGADGRGSRIRLGGASSRQAGASWSPRSGAQLALVVFRADGRYRADHLGYGQMRDLSHARERRGGTGKGPADA
jgi:hypothetical protein